MFGWIIFFVLIVCHDIDLIFYIALLIVIFSRPWTSHAGVLKMPRVSNEYGVLEVKCKQKWFWDLFLIISVHSNSRQLALYVLAPGDFVNWIKINKFLLKAHY